MKITIYFIWQYFYRPQYLFVYMAVRLLQVIDLDIQSAY